MGQQSEERCLLLAHFALPKTALPLLKASYIDGAPHEHDESSCEGTEPSAIQPLFGNFIFLLSLAVCYMLPVEWNIHKHFKATPVCPTKGADD